ncbi:TPA: tail-specific protease, partial [Candidatus Azambacteria bacterium]|nr:tail-specific protease [Candidatus Azambacteria bacterium]
MLALAVQAEPGKSEDDLVLPVVAQASHHATASKRITALFTRSHYVPMQLDDELSGRIFDMYLKNLDYY